MAVALAAILPSGAARSAPPERDPAAKAPGAERVPTRFIFYSVLEGLYEDGLANSDVEQLLLREPGKHYFHFVRACPICDPTTWALEAYRSRPEYFSNTKPRPPPQAGATFGPGFSAPQRAELFHADPRRRLAFINRLVDSWVKRRIAAQRLDAKERAKLQRGLEEGRRTGLARLRAFRALEHGPGLGVEVAAPAYAGLEECAVCSGALGRPLKFPAQAAEED